MNSFQHVTDLLRKWIRFPTISSTSNVELSHAIAARLDQHGFDVSFCDYVDEAGIAKCNVIASRWPKDDSQQHGGLAYFCHTDVVPVLDWQGPGDAFMAAIQDDKIYGRGSCDMKGSLVAMLAAVETFDHHRQTAPLHIVCTADEEVGFVGAKHLVKQSADYRELVRTQPLVIIGEPTSCQVVHAHKGIFGMRITSRGRAAHSSTRDGLNANLAMVPMLVELVRLFELTESNPALQDDRFDPPTLSWNFGVSDFATASNVVPARSEAWVSLRPMPGIDGESLADAVAAKASSLGLSFAREEGCRYVWLDPDSDFIRAMCAVAQSDRPQTVCYGTDGGEFTELKRMVICGPGDIAQAHTADEFLCLNQLQKGIAIYARAIEKWCGP